MAGNYVTLTALRATGFTLLVLTTVIFAARLGPVLARPKTFQWEDSWLIAAFIFYLLLAILYQVVANTLFKVQDVQTGRIDPYKTISDDGLFIQKIFFVCTSTLWFNLWSVKYSLLALYKRLIKGLKTYTIIWWAVVIFSFVVLVGAVTSSMLSCSSMKAWFTAAACRTPRDVKASNISLWYAFAVDVITDLMVMFLPMRLVWKLQMPFTQKAGIGGLFCLGWVCIIVAIIRVRELGSTIGENTAPSPTWLAFWGQIEASIAVIIGCCPGLYRFYKVHKTQNESYTPYGHTGSGFGGTAAPEFRVAAGDIPLQRKGPGGGSMSRILKTTAIKVQTAKRDDDGDTSSQEELTYHNMSK